MERVTVQGGPLCWIIINNLERLWRVDQIQIGIVDEQGDQQCDKHNMPWPQAEVHAPPQAERRDLIELLGYVDQEPGVVGHVVDRYVDIGLVELAGVGVGHGGQDVRALQNTVGHRDQIADHAQPGESAQVGVHGPTELLASLQYHQTERVEREAEQGRRHEHVHVDGVEVARRNVDAIVRIIKHVGV